jgi:hypothetical protein
MRTSRSTRWLPIVVACLSLTSAAEAVIPWTIVGGPGNACDAQI